MDASLHGDAHESRSPVLADLVTLTFHEARNVRHLVRDGKLEKTQFRMLIDALPTGRDDAWRELQCLRAKAQEAETAEAAEAVSRREFKLSLEDLVELFSKVGTGR